MCHCYYVEVWGKSSDLISSTVVLGFSFPITSPSAVVVSSPSIGITFVSCGLASDKVKHKFLVLWAPNLEQKKQTLKCLSEVICWFYTQRAEAPQMWHLIWKSKQAFPRGNIHSVITQSVKCLGAFYPLSSDHRCRGRPDATAPQGPSLLHWGHSWPN